MRDFLLSEEGGMVEWMVGAAVIGLGMIPVILGIINALNTVGEQGENRIRDIIWSGY